MGNGDVLYSPSLHNKTSVLNTRKRNEGRVSNIKHCNECNHIKIIQVKYQSGYYPETMCSKYNKKLFYYIADENKTPRICKECANEKYTNIEPCDIRIDTIKRNFVKLTHIPSGIIITKHNKVQCKAKTEAIEELTMLVELWEIERNE